jgi:[ribosomal protein S5]-alanine N-acetyltransferase
LQTDLSTSRCDLHPVTADNAAALHALWTSPGVRRYLWDDEIVSRERTDDAIATSERLFEHNDFGLWVMRERIDKSLAGVTGLYPFRDTHDVELVFAVDERLWGHGYAAEGAHAVIDYCFTRLQMPIIRASTDAENAASARVLEKLGFTQTRRATVGRIDTLFYERAR